MPKIPEGEEFTSIEQVEMWLVGMEQTLGGYSEGQYLTAPAMRSFASVSLYLTRRLMKVESELRRLQTPPQ